MTTKFVVFNHHGVTRSDHERIKHIHSDPPTTWTRKNVTHNKQKKVTGHIFLTFFFKIFLLDNIYLYHAIFYYRFGKYKVCLHFNYKLICIIIF